jgi:acyl-CoA hydrolase
MLKLFLRKIGIAYDPQRHAAPPIVFRVVAVDAETKDNAKKRETENDKNVKYIRGQAWRDESGDSGDELRWRRQDVLKTERESRITIQDRVEIENRNLDEIKYAQYKAIWAEVIGSVDGEPQYRSNQEIADEAGRRHGAGYKIRTTEKYVAAINAAR